MTAAELILSLPEKVTPAAIEGKNTRFHFDIQGDGGGEFTVLIDDGKMEVQEGFHGDPKCVVRAKDADFMKVVSGKMNPMMAVMMQKLKISNLGEMMEYAKIFGVQ